MPAQTNITDFDPVSGVTTTTLVSDHDRGTTDWAARQLGGQENVPMTPGGGTPPPADPPTLASIAPATAVAGGAAVTVTATGTNYASTSVIRINGVDAPTSFISATSLTTPYTPPAAAGSVGFTVKNADGQETGSVAFTTTAAP